MRKLRGASEAAIGFVEHLLRRLDDRVNHGRRDLSSAGVGLGPGDGALDHRRLLDHVSVFLPICLRDREQHPLETRTTVVVVRREVRAPIKWLAVGSKKGGQVETPMPPAGRTPTSSPTTCRMCSW